METHTNIYVCVCACLFTHIYMGFWHMPTEEIQCQSFSPRQTLRHKGRKLVCSRDGFGACWWIVMTPPQAHACTALGAAIYLDRRDGALHVVRRSCGSRRQTTSHKCKQKHTWRRLAPRPAALWAVRCGTVVRYEIFFLIPLHCKGYIFSLHPESWVRFCSHYYSLELTLKWI